MKLVLHIGTPKTASTFLQASCAQNRDWLAARGVLWPRLLAPTANHITLFFAAAGEMHAFARGYGIRDRAGLEDFRRRLAAEIARELAEAPAGIHTVLMSSENLTGNLRRPEEVARLAALLHPHFDEIRILVYARRQDEGILSMYAEYMRQGFSPATFDAFLDSALGPNSPTPYLYYRRVLSQWIEAFGAQAITVRLFDRARFAGGDVLSDFLTQVLGANVDFDAFVPSEQDNPSLAAPVLEFLRRLHPHIPFARDGVPNPQRTRLAKAIDRLPRAPRPQISAAQSARIMAHFTPANRWLQRTFFAGEPGPLFPDRDDLPEEGNLGRLTLADFAEFTGRLLGVMPGPGDSARDLS